MIQGPQVLNGSTAVRQDDQGSFAAHVVDEKLEEGVDGEGLVDVSNWVEELCRRQGHHANPRGDRVYGDHEKQADDISLEQGFPVVLSVEPLISGDRSVGRVAWLVRTVGAIWNYVDGIVSQHRIPTESNGKPEEVSHT